MKIFDLPTRIFFICATLFMVLVILASLNSPDGLLYLSPFAVGLLGKYACYAILALSIDLVWGYMGILSLGHGAFFALGGYSFGMYLMRQIGSQGVYAASDLPDFMIFIGWDRLPWYWLGTDMFWYACLLVVLVPGALGFFFGWTAFRSRVSGVYFSIISQAMTFALALAFFRNEMGFGGNNGFTDFKTILGFDVHAPAMTIILFALSCLVMMGTYFLCRVLAKSRLGLVCVAIRGNENRIRFAGYRVENIKLAIFTLSAMLAGLAGALYVPQAGIINPGLFQPIFSVEMVICVALGGRGTLYGPVLGAFLFNFIKTWLTTRFPELWQFAFGALFVLVTVFLPDGIVAVIYRLRSAVGGLRGKSDVIS